MAATEEMINQQTAVISKAKMFLTHLESPERSVELRKIFRAIAKDLHPDVNPNLTTDQLEIWHKILDAYKTGDLERLKALEVVYENQISRAKDNDKTNEQEIAIQNETLKEGIKLLEEELSELKKIFPFNIQDKINDDEWVKEQQGQIKEEMKDLNSYDQELKSEYENLMYIYG